MFISIAEEVIANENVPKLIVRMKGEEAKLRGEKGLGPDVALFAKGFTRDKRAGGARDYGKGGGSGGGERKRYSGEYFYSKWTGHCHRDCRTRIADEVNGRKGPAGVDTVAQAVVPGEKMWITASDRPTPTSAEPVWFVDSGCSNHVTGNRDYFASYTKFQPGEGQVRSANNNLVNAEGCGDRRLQVWDLAANTAETVRVQSVLYLPQCGPNNLLSVMQLEKAGTNLTFLGEKGVEITRDGSRIAEVVRVGNM